MRNISISNCNTGIRFESAIGNTFDKLTFENCQLGISFFYNCFNNKITKSTFINDSNGIRFQFSEYNYILENYFKMKSQEEDPSFRDAIRINSDGNNLIEFNEFQGGNQNTSFYHTNFIVLFDSNRNVIRNNIARTNEGGIIQINSGSENLIELNDLYIGEMSNTIRKYCIKKESSIEDNCIRSNNKCEDKNVKFLYNNQIDLCDFELPIITTTEPPTTPATTNDLNNAIKFQTSIFLLWLSILTSFYPLL